MDADRSKCISAVVSVYSGVKLLGDTCQHPGRNCWAGRTPVAQCKALPERLVDLSRAESRAKVADLRAAQRHPADDKTRPGMPARTGLDEGWSRLLTERQRTETARNDRANFVVIMEMKGDHGRRTDAIAPDDLILGEKTSFPIYYVIPLLEQRTPTAVGLHWKLSGRQR